MQLHSSNYLPEKTLNRFLTQQKLHFFGHAFWSR